MLNTDGSWPITVVWCVRLDQSQPSSAVNHVNILFVSFAAEATMASDLRKELEEFLKRLNIDTTCIDHPEVFTVEEMMPHVAHLSGAATKNLFLKHKRKKSLWLLSVRHDRRLDLGSVSQRLGLGGGNLRLADEETLRDTLRVRQGCVTPLALFCDSARSVTVVLDRDLTHGAHQRLYFHPMTNSATMGLKPDDLLRFLRETGHEPVLLSLD